MLKQIKGFEDYAVNENGNVWSTMRKKYLKTSNNRGYLQVILHKNGKRYSKKVHRLVAETFIPKTKEDIKLGRDHIDHIDGNKQNNHVSNLRWCTNKENHNFPLARENKTKANNRPEVKEKHSKANKIALNRPEVKEKLRKAQSKKPIIIDGVEYRSQHQAARELGISQTTICSRLKSKNFPEYQYLGK